MRLDQILAIAPMAAFGLGAVLAMMAAPLKGARLPHVAAAGGLIAGALIALARAGAPSGPLGPLMVDDGLARFGAVFAGLSGLAALCLTPVRGRGREGPALLALTVLGAAGLSAARHAAPMFLGLEVMTLSLTALFAFALTRPGVEAGYKFLILSGLASAALLLGMALIYAQTGALEFAGWRGGGMLFALGAALMLAGLAFKFSLAPFHMWTPDIFVGAPTAAAVLAGVVSKGAVAIVLFRLTTEAGLPEPLWRVSLAALATISILGGNLLALRQTGLPRMLGYSTVAHSGYVAAIIACGAPLSGQALLFYLAAYAPALIAALCASAVLGPGGSIEDLRGLSQARPLTATALSLGMVSMEGLPVAGGFIAKLLLFACLVQARDWGLLAVASFGSGLGFYYYARFFTAPLLGGPTGDRMPTAPRWEAVLPGVCALAMMFFGLAPGVMLDAAISTLAQSRVAMAPHEIALFRFETGP